MDYGHALMAVEAFRCMTPVHESVMAALTELFAAMNEEERCELKQLLDTPNAVRTEPIPKAKPGTAQVMPLGVFPPME